MLGKRNGIPPRLSSTGLGEKRGGGLASLESGSLIRCTNYDGNNATGVSRALIRKKRPSSLFPGELCLYHSCMHTDEA